MSPEQRSGPVAPQEIQALKTEQIPDEVFAVFNELIAQNLYGGRAVVYQQEVMQKLEELGMDRKEVYKRRWLDVEESYRAVGWRVEYDKPGYNETYEPFFKFCDESKKMQRQARL